MNPASDRLHQTKYRQPGESHRDSCCRIAGALADSDMHFYEFRESLQSMRFLPAGRVQRAVGAGRYVTAQNCFVSGTIPDSFVTQDNDEQSSIMDRAKEAALTMRMGGGIGYDFSTLRPRGALIRKLMSHSSGPLSFMQVFDAVCRATASSGHRRGAQMGVLRIDHPDIFEFINAKHDNTTLTGFNISVAVTDKFMECLANDRPFQLKFGGEMYGEVDPSHLWETLMRSTWDWAEPGILFVDTINRMNNLWYCEKIAATNPCVTGETRIFTRTGWRRIDETVGQTLDVWNGHEWSSVIPRVTGENQPTVRVMLSDGNSIQCTPYHKFILRDGRRVEARELKIGDSLDRHTLPVLEGVQQLSDAYEQGFFAGDGWVDQRGRTWIGLWGEKQKLKSEFSFEREYEYQCQPTYEGTNTEATEIRLLLGKNVKRPKTWVPGPEYTIEARLEWLAGLADSDGCVVWGSPRAASLQISSKDRDFANAVRDLLSTIGIRTAIGPMKDCWRFGVRAWDMQKLLDLGFRPRRLDFSKNDPQRSCEPYVRIVGVDEDEVVDKVYCFTEMKNHSAVFEHVYTAQCGEQPLPPFGACLLGSFNLTQYMTKSAGQWHFDYDLLSYDIPHVVRAMDNVVDASAYPLPQQRDEAHNKRRMGLGVTGLANAIEAMGHSYGSPEFLEIQDRIFSAITRECYRASALLAEEKGAFPLYNEELFMKGKFVKTLDDETRQMIRRYGLRNSHLTSQAPTGTISTCADNVSSGIEPVFSYEYERDINMPEGTERHTMRDYGYAVFGVRGKATSRVTVDEHLGVLAVAQRNVDSAVSKTCNVPGTMPWDEFCGVYKKAWELGCKGLTTFNADGKRMALLTAKSEERTDEQEPSGACTIDPVSGERSCAD